MKKFKVLMVLVALLTVIALLASCGSTTTTKPAKKIVLAKIPITLAASVHQADIKWEQKYAMEKYGAEVVYIDGKGDAAVTNSALEDLIARGVSGIIINPTDPSAINAGVREARAAKIPVITYFMTPTEVKIPWVRVNETVNSKKMGSDAAKKWKELYPNIPIKVAFVDFLTNPYIMSIRSVPFMEGVLEVDPTAKLVVSLDGAGDLQKAVVAGQDLLQSHPEVNIIYGTNAQNALGALSAFEAAGRGKAVNGNPVTEIFCGTDASEDEVLKLINPNSAFKFTLAMMPKENAYAQIDTLMKVINGEIDPDKQTIIDVFDKNLDYWSTPLKDIQDWMNAEYFTNVDLQAELDKMK
jgi:ABC-type sugar transport system substrate-binding protein